MGRHSIIATTNNKGRASIKIIQADSTKTFINLFDKSFYSCGLWSYVEQLKELKLNISETGITLAVIATLVTAADTRISRRGNAQDSWSREIDLYVPVDNTKLWNSNRNLLEKILKFLSGDRWRIYFRKMKKSYTSLLDCTQQTLGISNFDCVSLFSGGLDSFIGAIDLLNTGNNPLFVSHYWDPYITNKQNEAYNAIKDKFKLNNSQVRSRIGFSKTLVVGNETEDTMRARSFLFFSMAVLAASSVNCKKIYIPENGLISLNVPLNSLRLGALSTRTTHPFYMKRFQELVDGLNLDIEFINPYRFKTKGEMIEECQDIEFLKVNLTATVSCSSPTQGRFVRKSPGHCAHCVPCIIRHASIKYALKQDNTSYTLDIYSKTLNGTKAEGENMKAFKYVADNLNQNINYLKTLIQIPGSFVDYSDEDITNYAETYKRGILEVKQVTDNVSVS
jgi:7-cyano-7-deazaguanine synthase in queuosine biosynthesis